MSCISSKCVLRVVQVLGVIGCLILAISIYQLNHSDVSDNTNRNIRKTSEPLALAGITGENKESDLTLKRVDEDDEGEGEANDEVDGSEENEDVTGEEEEDEGDADEEDEKSDAGDAEGEPEEEIDADEDAEEESDVGGETEESDAGEEAEESDEGNDAEEESDAGEEDKETVVGEEDEETDAGEEDVESDAGEEAEESETGKVNEETEAGDEEDEAEVGEESEGGDADEENDAGDEEGDDKVEEINGTVNDTIATTDTETPRPTKILLGSISNASNPAPTTSTSVPVTNKPKLGLVPGLADLNLLNSENGTVDLAAIAQKGAPDLVKTQALQIDKRNPNSTFKLTDAKVWYYEDPAQPKVVQPQPQFITQNVTFVALDETEFNATKPKLHCPAFRHSTEPHIEKPYHDLDSKYLYGTPFDPKHSGIFKFYINRNPENIPHLDVCDDPFINKSRKYLELIYGNHSELDDTYFEDQITDRNAAI